MLFQKKISADQVLAASATFVDVPNANANLSFNVPARRSVARVSLQGTISVATLGERVDFELLLKKDGDANFEPVSGLEDKYETGVTGKTNGLAGQEGVAANALMNFRYEKVLDLEEGRYKLKLQYKVTAGAAQIEGATHDFETTINVVDHAAFLDQANVPRSSVLA